MDKLISFLDGKKSYIGAALIAIASFLTYAGIDPGFADLIKQLGEAILGVGLANKLVKIGK